MSINLQLNLGKLDKIDKCEQPTFVVDFSSENLAVFGNKFSGKTSLLKNIIYELHKNIEANEKIIILDFSNNLSKYNELPLVYGYFSGENEESIKRCLNEVDKALNLNSKIKLADSRSHYTFIVDGLDDLFFEGKYERHQEIFSNIVKKGLDNKISVIFTSYHSSGGVIRLLQFFKKVIAFDLPIEKYQDLFPKKVEKPMPLPGRGVANQGDNAYEFQAYFPFQDKDVKEVDENDLIEKLKSQKYIHNCKDKRIKSFSGELTQAEFLNLFPETLLSNDFFVGVDYTKFEPIHFNLLECGVIALYGTNFEDKLGMVKRIIAHAKQIKNDTVIFVWDDSRLRFVEKLSDDITDQIDDFDEFEDMFKNGLYSDFIYHDEDSSGAKYAKLPCFTIYIIQNPRFFNKTPGGEGTQLPLRMHSILQQASELNLLFIFTNIKPLPQNSMLRDNFNSCIKHAFLAGDIFHFIETRGRSSIFGELDTYELKQDFSRTTVGDGFYMDDESDYPQKLKFIVQNNDEGRNLT